VTVYPFEKREFELRLARTKAAMEKAGLDLLVICDPANMDYLTGYKGWSFYVPQCVLVHGDEDIPVWIGRLMDAGAARLSTWLPDEAVIPYADIYVQSPDRHPMDFVADQIKSRGWDTARIGLEMDAYYFSGRAADCIRAALPDARFSDCDHLVNWVRIIKSEPEIGLMRQAGQLAMAAMQAAFDNIRVGARQCDTVGEIYKAGIAGVADFGGEYTALCPMLPTGEGTATPHITWSDAVFKRGEPTILELGGSRLGYHAPIARTLHLGPPPQKLADTAKIVIEGMHAALGAAVPGALAEEVEAEWRAVISKHGLEKESRIGYSIGLGYPPDWGEHTVSFRPGDKTVLRENMTFHCIPGMWLDDWGFEVSTAFQVTTGGAKPFYNFPEELHVRD